MMQLQRQLQLQQLQLHPENRAPKDSVGKRVTRSKHVSGKYERKKNMQHLNGIVFYVNYAHCIFFA